MKITDKIFHIPPFISTTWCQIKSIHMKEHLLIVTIKNDDIIPIPGLVPEVVENIFNLYSTHLENEIHSETSTRIFTSQFQLGSEGLTELPIRFGLNAPDGIGASLQHNSAQMDAPDLPKNILQKISSIGKIISEEDIQSLPKAEPHCNCMHCQIVRAIRENVILDTQPINQIIEEPIVSDEELSFRQWDIIHSGDNLYSVVNRLDSNEKYSVYLGHPVGCTCGNLGCEHIVAVLKS